MHLADLASRFDRIRWNQAQDAFTFLCPACGGQAIALVAGGRISLECGAGCTADQMLAACREPTPKTWAPTPNPHRADMSPPANGAVATLPNNVNGSGGPMPGSAPYDFDEVVRAWQRRMGSLARNVLQKDPEFDKPHLTAELALEPLLASFAPIIQRSGLPDWQPPAELTPIEATELIEGAARTGTSPFFMPTGVIAF